jgi:hypothetical protein
LGAGASSNAKPGTHHGKTLRFHTIESRSCPAWVVGAFQRPAFIPAVCVVPTNAPAVFRHEGVRFVACPAQQDQLLQPVEPAARPQERG